MNVVLACVLVAAVFVSSTSANCKNRRPHYITHQWSSTRTLYCKYRGLMLGNGSSFTDLKRCQHCKCTDSGLLCCGICRDYFNVRDNSVGKSCAKVRSAGNMSTGAFAAVFYLIGWRLCAGSAPSGKISSFWLVIGFYAGKKSIPNCEVVPDKCEAAVLNKEKTDLCTPERRLVKTEKFGTYQIVSYLVTFVQRTVNNCK